MVLATVVAVFAVYVQFRGGFRSTEALTLISDRAGLTIDRGSRVMLNEVEIGWVARVVEIDNDGTPKAKLTLNVDTRYADLIPANVIAAIKAPSLFGQKIIALTSPPQPSERRLTPGDVIDISSVTTELNTVFDTAVSVAERVDPIRLNQTLSAAAQALDGQGARVGQSILDANTILAELNPRLPQLRLDLQLLAEAADTFAGSAPDLFDFLDHAATTARTLNDQRSSLDSALLAAVGLGAEGADSVERAAPFLNRAVADLLPTSELFDEYSPELFCAIRNTATVAPKVAAIGSNGYSLNVRSELIGAGNPYVYPDNLPRVNAHGGPEGKPGCWAPITRDLWPAPYLVMDTGASIAPYNHLGLGQPSAIDYIWGRQIGENTINP